jgi:uncharacterized membrane protein HdeD (DUF308 family)
VTKHRRLILPAVLVGIVLLMIGGLYITHPASGLPSFFPGHAPGSSHRHVIRGVAAAVAGAVAFVVAWFQTEPPPGSMF